MERPVFANEHIYHIYNRGVEKRDIFLDENDYYRFVHGLYEFNDKAPALSSYYYSSEVGLRKGVERKRRVLVDVLAFCLMPNHYHLLVKQVDEGGITDFMRKVGTGYTNYFNKKRDRVGSLFQGKFKARHVTDNAHLLYLPLYIHLNPLDLTMPEWRDKVLKNSQQALRYLETYRWSSHLDYLGKNNFPLITVRGFLSDLYGGSEQYRRDMAEYLDGFDLNLLSSVMIE